MEMVRLMEPGELPAQLTPDKILYLDTETTGLSGGAGTVAFLVGVGYLIEEGFLVHQYLMRVTPRSVTCWKTWQDCCPSLTLCVPSTARALTCRCCKPACG